MARRASTTAPGLHLTPTAPRRTSPSHRPSLSPPRSAPSIQLPIAAIQPPSRETPAAPKPISTPSDMWSFPSTSLRVALIVMLVGLFLLVNVGASVLPSATSRLRSSSSLSSSTSSSISSPVTATSTTSSLTSSATLATMAAPSTREASVDSPNNQILGIPQLPPSDSDSSDSSTTARPSRPSIPGQANIAYFLQIAEVTVPLLPRLLRTLHHPNNVYAIHFDLKIPKAIRQAAISKIQTDPIYRENVLIMPSELITYRGVSMLLNTIDAMRLLAEFDKSWDYFINLSGADYPLQTPDTIRKLLGSAKNFNFFSFANRKKWSEMAENRLSQLWFDEALAFRTEPSSNNLTKLSIRNPLIDRQAYEVSHAEAWMITSRKFCEYILRADVPRKLLVAFAFAVDASEHYFASLAWNVPEYKETIIPHSLRKIVWSYKGISSGQHPYRVDELEKISDDFNLNNSNLINNNVTILKSSFMSSTNSIDGNNASQERGDNEKWLFNESGTTTLLLPNGSVNVVMNGTRYRYKFQTELEQSALLFTRKLGTPDSALMALIDNRARDDKVIEGARQHLMEKVESRQLRVSEL